jgi:hypothetical protein
MMERSCPIVVTTISGRPIFVLPTLNAGDITGSGPIVGRWLLVTSAASLPYRRMRALSQCRLDLGTISIRCQAWRSSGVPVRKPEKRFGFPIANPRSFFFVVGVRIIWELPSRSSLFIFVGFSFLRMRAQNVPERDVAPGMRRIWPEKVKLR